MRKKPIRCPKCHKYPVLYREYVECHAEFAVNENGWPEEEGTNSEKSYFKLEAVCGCGHSWRIKNATQITDAMQLSN